MMLKIDIFNNLTKANRKYQKYKSVSVCLCGRVIGAKIKYSHYINKKFHYKQKSMGSKLITTLC